MNIRAPALLHDPAALGRAVEAFGRAAGTDETPVAISLFCQAWAVSVTRAAIADLVGARRVPDLSAANTVLHFDGAGRPVGSEPLVPRFAAVADDKDAARHPCAEILADGDALFAWMRATYFENHLGRLVEALHDLAPVGSRLLWGNVAAACAGGFAALTVQEPAPFDPEHVLPEAVRLLDWPGSPTEGLAELHPVSRGGVTRLFVRRQTCCLRYRLPDAPPTCRSCRLLPDAEWRRRAEVHLAGVGMVQEVVVGDRPAVGAGVAEPQQVAGPHRRHRHVAS